MDKEFFTRLGRSIRKNRRSIPGINSWYCFCNDWILENSYILLMCVGIVIGYGMTDKQEKFMNFLDKILPKDELIYIQVIWTVYWIMFIYNYWMWKPVA